MQRRFDVELPILIVFVLASQILTARQVVAASSEQNATADAPALSFAIKGERDTLLGLIDDVRTKLQQRKRLDDTSTKELANLQSQLNSPTLDSDAIHSVRDQLGTLVGRAAAAEFPGRDFIVWSHSRWADLGPHDWPAQRGGEVTSLPIAMARNAIASQAVAVTNTTDAPLDVTVKGADFDGAPQVLIRRGWHTACPDLRYRLDVLALVDNEKITLQPGETTLVWFEIDSSQSKAGKFTIPIQLKSSKNDANLELSVEVFDVTLPQEFDCALFNYTYVNEMGWIRAAKSEALEDCKRHGINTYIIPCVLPHAHADASGNLTGPLDFTDVDRQIETYRPYAKQIGFFWGGDYNRHLTLFPELEFLSVPWQRAVTAWYEAWLAHLEKMGLEPDEYFMYVYDERSSPEVQQVYAMLKKIAPQVRLLLNPTTGYKPDELRVIAPYVDIWMPSYEALIKPHPEDFDYLKSLGTTVWTYSCTNATPLPTYDYNLRRHWVAWDKGITGIAQWAYADSGGWEGENSWEFVNGDFASVYAKPHAPKELKLVEALTPSRRWEAWREGSQDYQLLNMAKASANNSTDLSDQLKTAVAQVVSDADDLQAADRARAKLLEIITASP